MFRRNLKRVINIFLLCIMVSGTVFAQDLSVDDVYEVTLGRKSAQILENKYGLIKDELLLKRVDNIGKKIASVSDRPNLPYSFKILKGRQVNAVCCAGGFIYLYKGLVDIANTDAELAAAIAHEVAHVVYKHPLQKDKAKSIQQEEIEADAMAVELTLRAGYNPYGMFIVVSKLADEKRKKGSHPTIKERLRYLYLLAQEKQITPLVQEDINGKAILTNEKGWQMEIMGYGKQAARQRAWLLAGKLYLLKDEGPLVKDKFKVVFAIDQTDIYYEQLHLYSIYKEDLKMEKSLSELTENYINAFVLFSKQAST